MAGALSRLIRVPGISAFIDLAQQIAEVRGWLHHLRGNLKRDTSALLTTADEIKAYLRDVGFERFGQYWHYGRQLISLQHRLLVEQVFSDMGEPWSELVTGFGALKSIAGITEERGRRATERTPEEFRRAYRRKVRGARYRGGGRGF